jgi:tetratricopeptide (TPR) repeat protein
LSAIRRTMSSHDTRDFVRGVLSGLTGSARLLASMLATIGRPVDVSFLISLSRSSPESFATDLQQLLARRVVTKNDGEIAFRHDLLREGVYRLIPPIRREHIHRLVADELQTCDERPGPLAEHYLAAREPDTAHEFALRAVSEADRRSALNEAIYFMKLAIRTSSRREVRCRLHHELAQRCFKLRRYEESSRQVQKALAMSAHLGQADHLRLVVLELDILVTLRRISTPDLVTHVQELSDSFRDCVTADVQYEILAILIRSAAIETDIERCAQYAAEMITFATKASGLLAARASTLAARCHSVTTSSSEAIRWVEQVEESLSTSSDPEAAAEIMTNIASVYYEGGRYHRALELYKRATTCIQSAGALHIWPRNATHMHMLLVEMGDFEYARQLEREIRAGWVEGDAGHHISTLEANVALMHYHLGQIELMRKHAQMSMQYPEMYVHRITCLALLGIADLEGGQLSAASARANEITCDGETSVRRFGDFSYVEIFLSRWHARCGRYSIAADGLSRAKDAASDRDLGGWLRLKLELATLTRRSDPMSAQKAAVEVRDHAREIGATPTVERANLLIARCG